MPEPGSTIVVGVDGSDRSADALAFAKRLAGDHARLVLVNVYPYLRYSALAAPSDWLNAVHEEADRTLATAAEGLPGTAETRAIAADSAAHGLQVAAEDADAALIVIGTTHRGPVGRVLAGTTAERLLNGAPCPVAVVPHGYAGAEAAVRAIGVGWDASPEAEAALSAAAILSRATGARVRALCAYEVPVTMSGPGYVPPAPPLEEVRDGAARELAAALDRLPDECHAAGDVQHGPPGRLLAEASEDLDLLVCGSRRYGPLRAVLLGSVTAHVVDHAACPVIVVPRGVTSPFGGLEAAFGGLAPA